MQIKNKFQALAITNKYKKMWKDKYPNELADKCGIYILTREENDVRYAYVGQAKKVLTRLAQHMLGYQHIDLSIKKHKLWSKDNLTGWELAKVAYCELDKLDYWEQYYIKDYANAGYQLRNKTLGGQIDKVGMDADKTPRGYYDGVKQGEKNVTKELKALVEKYLVVAVKKEGKLASRMLDKFNTILDIKGDAENGEKQCSVDTKGHKRKSN